MSRTRDDLPFESARRIARNTTVLLLGKVISKPVYLLYVFLVARALGVEGFGRYSFLLTFAGFFAVLADFGLKTPLLRAITRDRGRTSVYVFNAVLIKILLALLTILVYHAAVRLIGYGSAYGLLLYLALLIVLVDSVTQMLFEVFRAHEVMVYEAGINVGKLTLMFVATYAVTRMGYGLAAILVVMLLCVTLALAAAVSIYLKNFSGGTGGFERRVVSDFLRMAFVFGLGSGLYTLYSKIDVVMLERLVGQESVGVYTAAYTLLENLEVVSIVFTAAFMPYIIRTLMTSGERACEDSRRSMSYLLLLGLPTAILLAFFAKPLVSLLYGPAFGASAVVLKVIIPVLPVKYVFAILAIYLIAHNREVTGLYSGALGVAMNVVLNLFLIPRFAQVGAAVATVITESVVLGVQFVFVVVYTRRMLYPANLRKLVIANLVLAVFLLLMRDAGAVLTVSTSVLLYGSILIAMGFFRKEEKAFIRDVLRAAGRRDEEG